MTADPRSARRVPRVLILVCDSFGVGGAPDEFGHVIELERKAADAGGRRAHLDNQVADLGFRHLHAHHVPAVPARAGVEAEDLPAPA